MALVLSQYAAWRIMLAGRWQSQAFLIYIRKQIQQFSKGVSERMISNPNFPMSTPWIPVTKTMPNMPLRSTQEFSMAEHPIAPTCYRSPSSAELSSQLQCGSKPDPPPPLDKPPSGAVDNSHRLQPNVRDNTCVIEYSTRTRNQPQLAKTPVSNFQNKCPLCIYH
jgi:hypothetical protein